MLYSWWYCFRKGDSCTDMYLFYACVDSIRNVKPQLVFIILTYSITQKMQLF